MYKYVAFFLIVVLLIVAAANAPSGPNPYTEVGQGVHQALQDAAPILQGLLK